MGWWFGHSSRRCTHRVAGHLVGRALLDVDVAESAATAHVTDTFVANYALTAATFAIGATALAHV